MPKPATIASPEAILRATIAWNMARVRQYNREALRARQHNSPAELAHFEREASHHMRTAEIVEARLEKLLA